MTSKPSEDGVSVTELAAPDAEGTTSVFATEVDVTGTAVSFDSGNLTQDCPLLYTAVHLKKYYTLTLVQFGQIINIRNKS